MQSARHSPERSRFGGDYGRMSPSDGHTVAQVVQGLNQNQSAKNLENATEFTEPIEHDSNHIDIETDKSV